MKIVFTLVLTGWLVALTGQADPARQAEIWHFGQGISLTFADGTPQLTSPSAMEGFEGVVSQSDTLGNLLFYTNGGGRPAGNGGPDNPDQSPGIIWNRNHEVLYDMRGEEGGGFSAIQSSIVLPDPGGAAGIYHLFTMEEQEFDIGGAVNEQPQGRGLSYFTIDMNGDGGLGAVIDYQERFAVAYEALDATPRADGNGYWIVCHDNNPGGNGRIFVFSFTSAGIGTDGGAILGFGTAGRLEFSPDGNYLYHNGRLLAFNPATGSLGGLGNVLHTFPNASPAACFTPDSRYLYYTEGRPALGTVIVRYDLSDFSRLDVGRLTENSGEVALQTAGFQIGPDGNIYFVEEVLTGQDRRYGLSQITCVSSQAPELNRFLIDLAAFGQEGFRPQALPQYVDAIFRQPPLPDTIQLDTVERTTCSTGSVSLEARENGTGYRWSDGSTEATLAVDSTGTYCVTITGDCNPVVGCQTITFLEADESYQIVETIEQSCDSTFYQLAFSSSRPIDSIQVIYRQNIPDGILLPYYDQVFTGNNNIRVPAPRCGIDQSLTALVFAGCPVTTLRLDLPCPERVFLPEFTAESEEAL
ncbi:MAG: hypothetical protein AAFZ52_16115, partial [Bacteroidota bacterium]